MINIITNLIYVGGISMSSYVVEGATLKCSFGDKESKLKIPATRKFYINGKSQANIMDFKPKINITSFGDCSSLANPAVASATAANNGRLQKMRCIAPAIAMQWMNGKTDVLIENFPALLNTCNALCMFAGRITITDDGQK